MKGFDFRDFLNNSKKFQNPWEQLIFPEPILSFVCEDNDDDDDDGDDDDFADDVMMRMMKMKIGCAYVCPSMLTHQTQFPVVHVANAKDESFIVILLMITIRWRNLHWLLVVSVTVLSVSSVANLATRLH